MGLPRRPGRTVGIAIVTLTLAACSVHLVAPYSADLKQKASAMQAEVGTWDLTMRTAAGTIAADPRNPEVTAALNKWRGEADAMLTLAISNDPGLAHCGQMLQEMSRGIQQHVPAALNAAAPPTTGPTSPQQGCEAQLVADIASGIDDVARALKYCRVGWVPDSYFTNLAQNRTAAAKPDAAPNAAVQREVDRSCDAEFAAQPQTPTLAAEAGHGRAVAALLTTLQAIVYIETRKAAAATN
jgi:hypothetical protein